MRVLAVGLGPDIEGRFLTPYWSYWTMPKVKLYTQWIFINSSCIFCDPQCHHSTFMKVYISLKKNLTFNIVLYLFFTIYE